MASSASAPAYLRLRSAEKAVFILERSVALHSGLIKTMLSRGAWAGRWPWLRRPSATQLTPPLSALRAQSQMQTTNTQPLSFVRTRANGCQQGH